MSTVEVILLHPDCAPVRGSNKAAGFDLKAHIPADLILFPNESKWVSAGLRFFIKDPAIVAKIYPRSGLGSQGLVLGNLTGIIDADYQGEVKINLWNRTDNCQKIQPFQRIAQLVFEQVKHPEFSFVETFTEVTQRGEAGFGSTGV